MRNSIEPVYLKIIAISSAVLVLISFFSLPVVIIILVLTACIIGFISSSGDMISPNIFLAAIVGSIPVWIAIYLSFVLEDVPQNVIRIFIIGLLFFVGLIAIVKLWFQSLEERKQKKIEESIQREYERKLQIKEEKEQEQELIRQLQEFTQQVEHEKMVYNDEFKYINEPSREYKSEPIQTTKNAKVIQTKSKLKYKETSTPSLIEESIVSFKNIFVNYHLELPDCTESYAVLRVPQKGCIIRSHRYGKSKRRGFKEEAFQQVVEKYFNADFLISGNLRLNTGKETRPFEPDIALIEKLQDFNIRINIEIDEPYAGITRQPTHCKGDDLMRDTYFVDRGWMVIRFSEYQVHTQELSCIKFIAQILNNISSKYRLSPDLQAVPDLIYEEMWDIVQAQKWEKQRYRERYLNHTFGEVDEEPEVIERDFNQQEIDEESQVKPSIISIPEEVNNIGFNKINAHSRDNRIVF